ncbi:MAG: hypothetical protein IJJ82_07955 [Clostridia bacterium]|nr:hypothetical protein [Clostridia bacterium]
MQDRKLYTAKQISEEEIYGPKSQITPYKITQNWVKNGLKFVRGTRKEMLFKLEWIDEFLDKQANQNKKIANGVKIKNNSFLDLLH